MNPAFEPNVFESSGGAMSAGADGGGVVSATEGKGGLADWSVFGVGPGAIALTDGSLTGLN